VESVRGQYIDSPNAWQAKTLGTSRTQSTTSGLEVSNTLTGSWTTILEKTGNDAWTVIGASGTTVTLAAAGTGRTLHTVTDPLSHHFLRLRVTKTP